MSAIGQLTAYGQFAWGLRGYLNDRATPARGREFIRRQLQCRDSNFLTLVKRAVYENERSPYLALLRMAGCEYGDLERMVRTDGIESTMGRLCDAGVYVTVEEFKGRVPIVRGGKTVACSVTDFNNPFLTRSIATSSSGSRGAGTRSYHEPGAPEP